MADYEVRYRVTYVRLLSHYQEMLADPEIAVKKKQDIIDMVIGRAKTWLNTENVSTDNKKPKDIPFADFKKIVIKLPIPNKTPIEDYDLYPHWIKKD